MICVYRDSEEIIVYSLPIFRLANALAVSQIRECAITCEPECRRPAACRVAAVLSVQRVCNYSLDSSISMSTMITSQVKVLSKAYPFAFHQ